MEYLNSEPAGGCIFCTKPAEMTDEKNAILWRGRSCFVILNAYPYNPGHLMVVPFEHAGSITTLEAETLSDLMAVTRLSVDVISAAMSPDGFNIGINQSRSAGAGIADHVHQHVVPRWSGDTNFITTVGATKVLPELVSDTYKKLEPVFRQRGAEVS